jgi:hypothetical protein
MPKFQLLLLDANVIIYAHELGIWDDLIDKCEITITRTVLEEETYYWFDEQDTPHRIDLNDNINAKDINCIDVPQSQLETFLEKFDPTYLDRLDPGEADSLALLDNSKESWLICSSDHIVYKVLGCLGRGGQGKSLEEILNTIGLGRQVKSQYSEEFRKKCTVQGEQDGIIGMGLKEPRF